jgi:ceramide glucosyltransferase
MLIVNPLLASIGLAGLILAASYAVLTLIAVVVWQIRSAAGHSPRLPPVTVLKPLCGAEPGLYEHLHSFCRQDYPEFQIVFGVLDPADPALAVVQQLIAEFPKLPIEVVVDPQQHGSNRKISNLINMTGRARHDVLVIADSDTFVRADYLTVVTAPLLDQEVGLVTCLYQDVPTRPVWSHLGAMYINEWYMPSVLLTRLFGYQGYASGQTLCVRRDTLRAIGGLAAVANHLADDYRLGELVRGLGLRIVLSSNEVMAEHHEPDLASLTRHEVRWMRTIRALRPRSFRLMFLTFSLPLAVLGIVLTAAEPSLLRAGWLLFGITVASRLGLHFAHRLRSERALFSDFWLLPVRDLLLCWVWCRSFFTSRISWRGTEFDVDADGIMHRPS